MAKMAKTAVLFFAAFCPSYSCIAIAHHHDEGLNEMCLEHFDLIKI